MYTSTKSWRGYIFTTVCVSVCLSVCVSVCVPAKRLNRFERSFCLMFAYRTGSNPIEISDLGLKVKVTMTENVSKNDEKKFAKNSTMNIFEKKPYCLIEHFIAVIFIPNMTILHNK